MPRWLVIVVAVVAGLIVLGVALMAIAGAQWRRTTRELADRVTGNAVATPRPDTARLPPPVERYFEFALPPGTPPIRTARIEWRGEFRMTPVADWVPFTAAQHFSARPPGFVWDAEIDMMPVIPVRVRDSYLSQEAGMLGRMGGVVTVVDQAGTPELAAGALARWLGEAVWFPTALLGDDVVAWEAVDDSTARATVRDGGVVAAAEFRFAQDGSIRSMHALRWRDVDGRAELTPFEGVYRDWQRAGGVMVPGSAEVGWILPEGRFAYWRGSPVSIEYEFAR